MKIKCIKAVLMYGTGERRTTPGKVYEAIEDDLTTDEDFYIIDDIGHVHYFCKFGSGPDETGFLTEDYFERA